MKEVLNSVAVPVMVVSDPVGTLKLCGAVTLAVWLGDAGVGHSVMVVGTAVTMAGLALT